MDRELKRKLIEYLREFVTDERSERIRQVLDSRTRHITVVLEDIYQPHNASAVLRSCDCFGIQDVHIIENENEFDPNEGISIGAHKWLSLHRYADSTHNNTERCLGTLERLGYRRVALVPPTAKENVKPIRELDLSAKTALLFGTELEGLSGEALGRADIYATVPMYGFSESFNISVSVAIVLYELTRRLRAESTSEWKLTPAEREDLKLDWLKKSIRAGDELEQKFLDQIADS